MCIRDRVHFGNAEDAPKLAWVYLHWSGPRCRTGRRLWECRRHACVEGGVAFGFLEHLVNMAIEDCEGAKAFQVTQSAFSVAGAPPPLRVNLPERDVREDDDGHATGNSFEVILHPVELIVAELAQTALADVHDVV